MRILVTGGSGFIGSNLVEYLLDKYPKEEVVNYSRHTYAMNPLVMKHLESNTRYKFIAGDVSDGLLFSRVLTENDIDVIYHLAAETHVDRSFLYPRTFLDSNLVSTFTILEVIRHMPTEKRPILIYMSTDEVFGDVPPQKLCTEEDQLQPRNPYSASKAAAEMYVNAYHHSFGISTIIFRSMNNFGPRQHPEKLIGKIITRCLSNTPFTLYEGGSVRGWIYVKDTCEALDTIFYRGSMFTGDFVERGGIYHIPPTAYLTVAEVAENILRITGKQDLFQGYKGRRLKDDERYALDGSKMTRELGWAPKISFEEGLRETIKWFKENEWYWRGVYSP